MQMQKNADIFDEPISPCKYCGKEAFDYHCVMCPKCASLVQEVEIVAKGEREMYTLNRVLSDERLGFEFIEFCEHLKSGPEGPWVNFWGDDIDWDYWAGRGIQLMNSLPKKSLKRKRSQSWPANSIYW